MTNNSTETQPQESEDPPRRQWSERFEKIRSDPQFQDLLSKLPPEDQDRVQVALQELVDRVERQVLNPLAAAIGPTKVRGSR